MWWSDTTVFVRCGHQIVFIWLTHKPLLVLLLPLSFLSHRYGFIHPLLLSLCQFTFLLLVQPQLQHEKAELEQHLEQEQEFQVNKLMKKIKKMENETISKQLTLEQVCPTWSSKMISGSRMEQYIPKFVCPVVVVVQDAKISPPFILPIESKLERTFWSVAGSNLRVLKPHHNVSMLWWQIFL